MENLRTYAADYTDLTHRLAKWLGVHTADAAAFAEILYAEDKGTPLSPARLSERIALSSGATTALLDRLERAGLLIRTREHADRRVVTLRSVPAISPVAREFFAPLGQRVGALMATYDQATLREFQRFLVDLHATMTDVSDNLDELVGERFDSHTREP